MESVVINIVWVISGLGIILYPAILLANVMSFRAKGESVAITSPDFWRKTVPFKSIQLITTLFPVVDYVCQRYSRTAYESGFMLPAILWMLPPMLTTISIFWVFKRSRSGVAV